MFGEFSGVESGDKSGFDATNRSNELVHIGRPLFDIRVQRVHDGPRQARVNIRASLDQIVRWGGIVLEGRSAIENRALPRMLERAQAIASHAKRKDVDTFVGVPPPDDLRRHVQRRAGTVSWGHERWLCRHCQAKVDQFDVCRMGRADEVSRADVPMNETL